MAGRWSERIGRGLVVTGAAIMVLSVCSRTWWVVRGRGLSGFPDRLSWIGPITGTWCDSDSPWCHEEHFEFLGHGFATAGAIAFYAALVTAAAVAMLVVAKRRFVAPLANTAIITAIATAIIGVVAARLFHARGIQADRGAGAFVLLGGAACVVIGALLARRGEGSDIRARPLLGRVLVGVACVLALATTVTNSFWRWHWSDESNRVGLDSSERCWADPAESHCSTAESTAAQFELDREDHPMFETVAAQTQHVAMVTVILALLALFAFPWLRFAHVLWIVTGLLAYATFAIAPDLGTARDVKLGVGFPLLWLACALGYAGHLLAGDRRRA